MNVSPLRLIISMLVAGAVLMAIASNQAPPAVEKMEYSELVQLLKEQPATITSITVNNGTNEVVVERQDHKPTTVVIPSKAGEESILQAANEAHVKVLAAEKPAPTLVEIVLGILFSPLTFFVLIFFFLMGRLRSGIMPGAGQAVDPYEPSLESKTFADVAGCNEAKVELEEVVEYLQDPKSFAELGAKLPRGVLLIGGPGNGKTLLAKAVAGEAGVPFFSMSGSQFVEMFVGVGARRARDLFEKARKHMPCIIFIDEIDAVGKQRGGGGPVQGHDEREQTLNEILVQMDGFTANDAIVLIAATNRPDVLDQALLRSGRFDRHIMVDSPDLKGREDIFGIHVREKPLDESVNLKVLAGLTPGFSGADIAAACNEAATVARRRIKQTTTSGSAPRKVVNMDDFSEGIDRVQMGPARPRVMSEKDRRNTAIHEAGHAVVGYALNGEPVRKITIMPRAKALGFTLSLPEGDRYGYNKQELLNRIASMMGGRVAQEIVESTTDTGAENDFEQATSLARRMVTKFGMSPLGHISISDQSTNPFLTRSATASAAGAVWGPTMLDKVDEQTRAILDEATAAARNAIEQHRAGFDAVVKRLLEKETILGEEFEALMATPAPAAQLE